MRAQQLAKTLLLLSIIGLNVTLCPTVWGKPWKRHTIDASSRGADGVRLADVNADRQLDIVTGWEEGGKIRVYVNPGPARIKRVWPAVNVGNVNSPEDAVFVDLDGDGRADVVSSCEGQTRTMFAHWAPSDAAQYLDPKAWKTQAFPATAKKQSWMFALPMDVDGKRGIDLIVSSKGRGATISWLESPQSPRDLSGWVLHPIYQAGWIMSLQKHDVDGDDDLDIVTTDRRGKHRGVLWLENPGAKTAATGVKWKIHRIGATGREVLFMTWDDLDGDGRDDVVTTTREGVMYFLRRKPASGVQWESHIIRNPEGVRNGKAVRVADINLDGKLDLVHSSNTGGDRSKPGVCWMSYRRRVTDPSWDVHEISGSEGVKFDLIELADLDGDGDQDVITCEERDNLGVFWYENPTRVAAP